MSTPYDRSKIGNLNFLPANSIRLAFVYADDSKGFEAEELLVGAGFRSFRASQEIAVSQEGSLGFFDIVETIPHNVTSNTLTCDKMTLRLNLLANVGLAPVGLDVLASPALHCYAVDPKASRAASGAALRFYKMSGLTINSNGVGASLGQTVMENVTFRFDKFESIKPEGEFSRVMNRLKKVYPSIYSGIEKF